MCFKKYKNKELSEDEICSILYNLISKDIYIFVEDDIKRKIYCISDKYYLAMEDIYGSTTDVIAELEDFLKQYEKYNEGVNL